MRELRIVTTTDPDINITVPMGIGVPTIDGGLGGWEEIERLDDVSATGWNGQETLKMSIPVMLDGWGERRSVQRELNTILKLGRDASGDESVPPIFKLFGPIHFDADTYPKLRWVLGPGGIELSTDEDDVERGTDGTLYRQALDLHVMEYVKPDEIRVRRKHKHRDRAGIANSKPLTHKVREGETLESIAKDEYGDWKKWKAIGELNNLSDPHRKLPAGRVLRLP